MQETYAIFNMQNVKQWQKVVHVNKSSIFVLKIYYRKCHSHLTSSHISRLLLATTENQEYDVGVVSAVITLRSKFVVTGQLIQKLSMGHIDSIMIS
jgi:hypothetical protein